MLGKGEKRKFDEHEDGLEGKILAPSDGPSKVSYTLQRQTIFNISLMKLYNHRPLTEPSLQKTVLINNMLRRIQEELKQEGSLRPALAAAAAPAPAPPPPPGPLSDSYREAPPPAPAPAPAPPPPAGGDLGSTTPLDACLTPASLLEDDDDGTFCTSPAAPPAAPLRLPAAGPDGSRGGAAAKPDDPKLMDPLPGNFEITTSTGFLTDLTLDDILFADIDTSMYDFDPCTSAAGTASKMAPVSVSADDLLKTLAPYSSQPVAPSQPFKMDLTELDHIMEVLVGS